MSGQRPTYGSVGRGRPGMLKNLRRASMIIADTGERIHRADSQLLAAAQNNDLTFYGTRSDEQPLAAGNLLRSQTSLSWDLFKCTLSYAIASLFVFSPLGQLFAEVGSKHQLATVGVYFHAARSVGNMIQSLIFVLVMLTYVLVVSVLSMLVAHALYQEELFGFSYSFIMLLGFFGGSLGYIGYLKMRMDNPSFNTACSVAIIALVINLIKEDDINNGILSFDQMFNYFSLILTGVLITSTVCFCVRPRYSSTELKVVLMGIMDRYASMLEIVSHDFAIGESVETDIKFTGHKSAADKMRSSCHLLLEHARLEMGLIGMRRPEAQLLGDLVDTCSRLETYLGGLTHCTLVLSEVLKSSGGLVSNSSELAEFHATFSPRGKKSSNRLSDSNEARMMFNKLILQLEPATNSFVVTLTDVIRKVRFDEKGHLVYNEIHRSSIQAAIALFSEAREQSLEYIYEAQQRVATEHLGFYSEDDLPEREAIIAICGNFSYLLEDLGEEILKLLEVFECYEAKRRGSRSFDWSPFVAAVKSSLKIKSKSTSSRRGESSWNAETRWASIDRPETFDDGFQPEKTFRVKCWHVLRQLNQPQIRFAIKTAIGAIILAAPAFFENSRGIFKRWRGEWALIVYMIMMARNLGAMTGNIPYRFSGTAAGAIMACGLSYLFEDKPLLLWAFGIVVAGISFAWILQKSTPFGRFALLTYNLICLYGYSHSRELQDPAARLKVIYDIAFHRSISVSVGVMWSVIVTLMIMPTSARAALKKELSFQWIKMGLLWKANPLATQPRKTGSARQQEAVEPRFFKGVTGGQLLQDGMLNLKSLLSNSESEFRLRGTFDSSSYSQMLNATQIILDTFHSLDILIVKSPTPTSNEAELITLTRTETAEISSCLFVHFYTAASSIRLGFPLPDVLPLPNAALKRMLTELQSHRLTLQRRRRSVLERSSSSDDMGNIAIIEPRPAGDLEDFVLFYSYMLATLTITSQLQKITDLLSSKFGVLYDDSFQF